MEKEIIYIGNGILEHIKNVFKYKTIITKEFLLEFAQEQDKEFEKKHPYCRHKNIVTDMILECLEYNPDTKSQHYKK